MRHPTIPLSAIVFVGIAACDVTGPKPTTIEIEGRVINRETGAPLSATVRLQHEENIGDGIMSNYRTVVDASTRSDEAGFYSLAFTVPACDWYALVVEERGFKTFNQDRVPCVDGVQTIMVHLDPGICVRGFLGECDWIPPRSVVPLVPAENDSIRQNDPTIGCPAHPYRGYGFQIRFAWKASTHQAVTRYRLVARRSSAPSPVVDIKVSGTEYIRTSCTTFVSDSNLDGWEWMVEALDVHDEPVQSSPSSSFRFLPCRLDNRRPCHAADPS